MSSPRHIEAGAPRARRIAVAFVTAFLLASLSGVAISGLAVADDAVKQTKHELREAKERVRARRGKIRDLQRRMNVLATRISKAEKEIGRTQAHIAELQKKMSALRARADLLQSKLDDRNRSAYMNRQNGSSSPLIVTRYSPSARCSFKRLQTSSRNRAGMRCSGSSCIGHQCTSPVDSSVQPNV